MTKNMKMTLERLFRTKAQTDFVTLSTADALERLGLVRVGKRQRTAGGQFPEYYTTLTAAGRNWCLKHYAKVGQRDAP